MNQYEPENYDELLRYYKTGFYDDMVSVEFFKIVVNTIKKDLHKIEYFEKRFEDLEKRIRELEAVING